MAWEKRQALEGEIRLIKRILQKKAEKRNFKRLVRGVLQGVEGEILKNQKKLQSQIEKKQLFIKKKNFFVAEMKKVCFNP